MLIQKITSQLIQQEMLACRSPQQSWRVFVNHYSTRKGEERYQLETEWSDLHQRENEEMLDYLSRASAIRLKFESYGDTRDDRTMCAHIARHLSDTYERVRDFLILDVCLSSRKLEEVLRTASHEKQRSGRWRGRDGSEERIALVAAGAGRNSGASRAGGHDYWERNRNYPPGFFCQMHGDNSNHDTSAALSCARSS